MRRLGRDVAEAVRRGLDEGSAAAARELASLDKAMAEGKQFDGLLAALGGHVDGYTEIASEGGVHWYARDDGPG